MDDFDHDNSVIDLTNSFTFANHCALANLIIDLDTDDSINEINEAIENSPQARSNASVHSCNQQAGSVEYKKQISKQKNKKKQDHNRRSSTEKKEVDNKFGCCPICWDELGKNSLASTKCGHVFCLKCLERSLCIEKRCPTCRTVLKGVNAYHPLYLPM